MRACPMPLLGRVILATVLASALVGLSGVWTPGAYAELDADPSSGEVRQEPAPPDAGAPPEVAESGIVGQAALTNTCPGPVRLGSSCGPKPYQATVSILDVNGQPVERFQTEPDGTFRVPLPPGDYVLHPESPGRLPFAPDQSVTVVAGQFTPVQISYDTGMR